MPWCRVYLPSVGWVKFDLTDDIVGNPALIRVGVARSIGQLQWWAGRFCRNGRAGQRDRRTELLRLKPR